MGTEAFSMADKSMISESEIANFIPYSNTDYSGDRLYVKCLKCNQIYQIGKCKNCGNSLFRRCDYGERYKSLECTKCGHNIEWWLHDNCGCKNPLINTIYKR